MTKLSGTSGQLFSEFAESLNMRGTSRSAKGAATKRRRNCPSTTAPHRLEMAKRALNDEGSETAVKAGTLRTRLAHQSGKGNAKDETVHERTEEPRASETSTEKSSDKSKKPSVTPSRPTSRADRASPGSSGRRSRQPSRP